MSESRKILPIPSCAADVASWCERCQSERLNDSAREAIGLAAMALDAMFAAVEEAKEAKAELKAARDALDPSDTKARARLTLAIAQLPSASEIMAKALPGIEKQQRVALQCDKGEADRSLVSLREFAARQEELAEGFGPSRDDEPEEGPSSPQDAPDPSTPSEARPEARPEDAGELVGELVEHVTGSEGQRDTRSRKRRKPTKATARARKGASHA